MGDVSILAQSFAGRESEMNAKCAIVKDNATLNECRQYKAYLESKSSDLGAQIDSIKNKVSAIGGNIDKTIELVNENNTTIATYDKQIRSLQENISTMQTSIEKMEEKVNKKQKNIDKRDILMKKRIVEMQASLGGNQYVDFIMGSNSFSDLLRRSGIVRELSVYENDQISLLTKEKKQMQADKKIIVLQRELLENQQNEIADQRERVVEINDINKELIAQYHAQEADLNAQKVAAQMQQDSIKNSLPSISTTIPPELGGSDPSGGGGSGNDSSSGSGLSTYLAMPISKNLWTYMYGTWAYPGGGLHLGMDLSTYGMGKSVMAPATGIILSTYGGCQANGGLGSTCGIPYAGGNNVLMGVQLADGRAYGLSFYHLISPSVKPGQIVNQGQQIGVSGNSGNSSGAHCHVEVFYLGYKSLEQIRNEWNLRKDYTFDTSWTSTNACGSAPCRIRPESLWL